MSIDKPNPGEQDPAVQKEQRHFRFEGAASMMPRRTKDGLGFSQDSVLADDAHGFYAVADGVGGTGGGDIASQLAIETAKDVVGKSYRTAMSAAEREALLTEAMTKSEQKILDERDASPIDKNMSTTFSGLLVGQTPDGHPEVTIGWAGDTRGYRFRLSTGTLTRLTIDDRPLELLADPEIAVLPPEVVRAIEQSMDKGRDVSLPDADVINEAIIQAIVRLDASVTALDFSGMDAAPWQAKDRIEHTENSLRTLQVIIQNARVDGASIGEALFNTRSTITRHLGAKRGSHVATFPAEVGDLFLTMSDGLGDVVTEEAMQAGIQERLNRGDDLANILAYLEDLAMSDLSSRQKGAVVETDAEGKPALYSGDDLGLAGVQIKAL